MNFEDLYAEMGRLRISIPRLAEKIGMNKKTLYSRMRGDTEFNQSEIAAISKELQLSTVQMLNIFFNSKVS